MLARATIAAAVQANRAFLNASHGRPLSSAFLDAAPLCGARTGTTPSDPVPDDEPLPMLYDLAIGLRELFSELSLPPSTQGPMGQLSDALVQLLLDMQERRDGPNTAPDNVRVALTRFRVALVGARNALRESGAVSTDMQLSAFEDALVTAIATLRADAAESMSIDDFENHILDVLGGVVVDIDQNLEEADDFRTEMLVRDITNRAQLIVAVRTAVDQRDLAAFRRLTTMPLARGDRIVERMALRSAIDAEWAEAVQHLLDTGVVPLATDVLRPVLGGDLSPRLRATINMAALDEEMNARLRYEAERARELTSAIRANDEERVRSLLAEGVPPRGQHLQAAVFETTVFPGGVRGYMNNEPRPSALRVLNLLIVAGVLAAEFAFPAQALRTAIDVVWDEGAMTLLRAGVEPDEDALEAARAAVARRSGRQLQRATLAAVEEAMLGV